MPSRQHDLNKNITRSTQTIIDIDTKPSSSSSSSKRDPCQACNQSSLCQGIKKTYFDYCANTSIHGVQYLGEKRPWKERLFWVFVFIASIYCCLNLIQNIYAKWDETPVIVSFSEKSTPVWSIPFPAVTICSETKRVKTKGPTYAELLERLKDDIQSKQPFRPNLNSTEFQEFLTLLHICNTQIIDRGTPRLAHRPIDHIGILNKMLPSFERYYYYCKWFSHFSDCDELFTKIYTEEGICYTFNGLNGTDLYREDTIQYREMGLKSSAKYSKVINRTLSWSLGQGYTSESGLYTYPARVLSAGSRAGLFVALQSFTQELDYGCRGAVQGFKVLLHSPDDVPLVSKQFVRIPMGKEIVIAVKPNMITTSAGIAEYHPHRRQCYLNDERKLKFFKIYSQNNCELECLTNFTMRKCGCVKFSMPRTADMPVCGEDKITCYDRAEDDLLLREFTEHLNNADSDYRSKTECNCMPACISLTYNTEISQGNFDLEHMLSATNETEFLGEFPGSQISRLSIYFKENQFITSKRSELYGITDFLANCGGIFGLFMGFSILSMVEMLYHFSLRLWSNMMRRKNS